MVLEKTDKLIQKFIVAGVLSSDEIKSALAACCFIVDDDEDALFIGQKIVSKMGFTTHTARSAVEALAEIEKKLPQLILLDWNMPSMSGLEFIAHLKKIPGGYKIPIIMCTGESDEKHVRTALANGVKGYLVKPFSESDVAKQFEYLKIKP